MSDYSAVAPPPQQNFNQSTAFAAALQRAKQIAAKINPGAAGNDTRPKRPLEDGSEPDAKKGPGSLGPIQPGPPGLGRPPQNPGMGGAPGMGGMQQVNEDMKVPDKMVGLIIGRGGEQITRLQSEAGCKIQMAPDSQGMPDRICSLSGPKDAVERAKQLITDIIRQRGGPPGGTSDDELVLPNNHSDFPGMNNMGMGGGAPGGAPGGGGGGGGGPGGRNSLEIMIPGPKVGLIIGKGGETIKQLQEKSGAKMVVIQDGPNQEHEKPLVISGDPQKVEYAKQLVYDLIAEKEMKNFNRGGGRGPRNQGQNEGYNDYGGGGDQVEVLVPRPAVGVVIGKGGDMIKKIQAETGAKVQFQQARDEGPGDRRCFLSGNPKQVEMARQRIDELIDSVLQRDGAGDGMGGPMGGGGGGGMRGGRGGGRGGRGGHHGGRGGGGGGFDRGDRNGGGDFGGGNQWEDRRGGGGPGGHQGGAPQDVVSFTVPSSKCGVIIGRGGETIKQINQQSGAYCELDRRSQNPNSNEKVFLIKGDPDSIETAKRIIQDKVQMPLSFVSQGGPPMNANMPTAYPGMAPQGYNPQNNWGMQGAGGGGPSGGGGYQQQQQWGGPQQGNDSQNAPPNPVQVNPSTGQPDYSMQWAEYYRSLGMHREAEMIEQQAKAKASGGGAAPGMAQAGPAPQAAAPAAAQAAAPTASSQADYSAQWAEYYRSIGKHKEAEAIESQMKNKGGATTGAPGSTPTAPGTQPGYSQPQSQAPYGGYQPQAAASGYYGAQPQSTPVPGGVPQGGYGFPSYGYGGQQGGGPPSQD